MAYRTIGKTLPRIEGYGKVTGQTKYAADLPFEGLLWAKVLRASVAHARIVKVDTTKARALKGVRAVLTGADVKDIFVGTRVKGSAGVGLRQSAHGRGRDRRGGRGQ